MSKSWVLGSLFLHDGFVLNFIKFCNMHHIPHKICAVYGGMFNSWVGDEGPYAEFDEELFKEIVEEYNKLGVSCYINCSNKKAKPNDENILEILKRFNKKYNIENKIVCRGNTLKLEAEKCGVGVLQSLSSKCVLNSQEDGITLPNHIYSKGDVVIVNERLLETSEDLNKFFKICKNLRDDSKDNLIKYRLEYNDFIEEIISKKRANWRAHNLMSPIRSNVNNVCMLKAWGLSAESFIRDMGDFMYGGSVEFLNFVTLMQRGEI